MADANKMRSEASTSSRGGNGERGESVIMDVGRRESTCGYCKSGGPTKISHGLMSYSLAVDDYQALLDKGWRRSGCFLYKPEMETTCCPSYTIRLKANDFIASKEQIRVSKRMQRFLDGTLEVKLDKLIELEADGGSCSRMVNNCNTSSAAAESVVVDYDGKDKANNCVQLLSEQIDETLQLCVRSGEFPSDIQLPKASIKKVSPANRKLKAEIPEDLIFSCNIAFQIAVALRQTRKDVEGVESFERGLGGNRDSADISTEMIAGKLASRLKQLAESCDLSVRACNGHINFYSATGQSFLGKEVGEGKKSKLSLTGSGGNDRHSKKSCGGPQGQRRSLEIRLKRASFDYEEYSLYRKYQLRVHNDTPDDVTESSYKRFLVDTPLVHIPPTDDGATPPCGFGSFHQQYVIDGKLIAVGVIDILPKCLSSKYLFWDPDLAFLSLGKYSALEEISWINENQMYCPNLQYYYLGYYIHSCSKMRYKAAYRPSELLCPFRFQWVPYDIAKPFLDRRKYVILSDLAALQNGDSLPSNILDNITDSDNESDSDASGAGTVELEDTELGDVLIEFRGSRLRYKNIRSAFDYNLRNLLEAHLRRYVKVVGTQLSCQMVYSLG